eukprot:TRINITY_DN47432_c0_g1_i1.p1 TRINITY_DN47432_c0_g1~~TRINITY_DN47432_c0_g1_i1.p1  ORF type:complete len:369 (+),score=51.45 TRINITY_DN47432_c0_g1_i1:520-1626(+)
MITNGNSATLGFLCSLADCLLGGTQQDGKRSESRSAPIAIVENPTYFLAGGILKDAGLRLLPVPTDENGMDVDALERLLGLCTEPPKLLYTIPSFHNPTGSLLSVARRKKLLQLAEKYGFVILSDEPYNLLDFRDRSAKRPPPLVLQADESHGPDSIPACHSHVVSMSSFSKIIAPGLRLGWIHADPQLLDRLVKNSGALQSGGCLNPVMGNIVKHMIDGGGLDKHLNYLKVVFSSRLEALCQAAELYLRPLGATWRRPEGGYFFWLRLPSGMTADAVFKAAQNEFVFFTKGTMCSAKNAGVDVTDEAVKDLLRRADALQGLDDCSSHVRFSMAFYNEEELKEGMRRVANAIRRVQDGEPDAKKLKSS